MPYDPLFSLRTTVKTRVPYVPYEKIAAHILGGRFSLSVLICADTLAGQLNKKYRQKSYSPNVLSFPYSKTDGEIILNVRKAEREARAMGIPLKKRLALLFVHGCFHLKGHLHGRTMEGLEEKVLRDFKLL